MFTVNISTQKITDAEKILALGKSENLAKIDFALVDAAGEAVNAENCKFELMIGGVDCPRYKTDANIVSFRYIALDITKAETDFSLNMKKDDVDILNDSIKVTAEVQGGDIVLPEVTVTADKMLKDITAINTNGEVVTGSIEDSIITETDSEVTISSGWLAENKTFQVGGSSEVQGIVFDNTYSLATTVQVIPPSFTAEMTDFIRMFNNCSKLTSISSLDTSNGSNFSSMFKYCESLTSVPVLNTSKGTNFKEMFYNCKKLTSIPQIDCSMGTNFSYMFYNCTRLTSIPQIDCSMGTDFSYMFYGCSWLKSIPQLNVNSGTNFFQMFYNCSDLKDFGGLLNIKYDFDLSKSTQLTHQSLINVLNGLYDLTGSTSKTLTLGSTNLAKLTDEEKAIATNKNWILQA